MERAFTSHNRFALPRNTILDQHAHLVERLTDDPPKYLRPSLLADAHDFLQRAEHLKRLMTAVSMYVDSALEDIARSSNIHVERKYLMGLMEDLTAEVCRDLEGAADLAREAA